MLLALSTLALAHPHPEPTEAHPFEQEIVVWGDPFLQWDQRWLVKSEFRFPVAQWLAGSFVEVPTLDLRIRAVLDCDGHPETQRRRKLDVTCTIDDVSLQALELDPAQGDATVVLEEWDALMTGLEVDLRVRDDRSILATDLRPVEQLGRNERRRREMVRQLVTRLVAPLQMELPEWVAIGSSWFEPRTRLLQMPTTTAPFGISEVVHRLDEVDGHWVVQTQGRSAMMPGLRFAWTALDVFQLEMDGVARFDPQTGLMVERVWHVGGRASRNRDRQRPYHTYGQLLLLGERDRPFLGRTQALPLERWGFDETFAPGA